MGAVNQAASRKQEYKRNVAEYDSSLDPRASYLPLFLAPVIVPETKNEEYETC